MDGPPYRAGKRVISPVILVGLRGVGKTVLLDRIREEAEAAGMHALFVESPEDRPLPALLAAGAGRPATRRRYAGRTTCRRLRCRSSTSRPIRLLR